MAASNEEKNITYYYPYQACFATEVEAGTPGAVARTNKRGRKVHELHYNTLSGHLANLLYRKREHDGITYRTLVIQLSDEIGTDQLEMDVFTDTAHHFFQVMESIELDQEIKLRISPDGKGSKLFVQQGGQWLKWNHTKAEPNGMPAWEYTDKTDIDGNPVREWNKDKQVGFFIAKLIKLSEQFNGAAPPPLVTASPEPDEPPANPADDLPF